MLNIVKAPYKCSNLHLHYIYINVSRIFLLFLLFPTVFRLLPNTLCRIVTRTHRFSSVTGPFMSLHWLPVKSRVQFKVCLITYKVYKIKYPAYLEDCVEPYKSIYNTRHSEPSHHILTIPHYDYKRHKSFKHPSNSYFCSAP